MSTFDHDRARVIKRLYERQLDKAPPKLPPAERRQWAASRLDALLGPQWRAEAQAVPGIASIEIAILEAPARPVKPSAEHMSEAFVQRAKRAAAAEGMHPDGFEPECAVEAPSPEKAALRALSNLEAQLQAIKRRLSGAAEPQPD